MLIKPKYNYNFGVIYFISCEPVYGEILTVIRVMIIKPLDQLLTFSYWCLTI